MSQPAISVDPAFSLVHSNGHDRNIRYEFRTWVPVPCNAFVDSVAQVFLPLTPVSAVNFCVKLVIHKVQRVLNSQGNWVDRDSIIIRDHVIWVRPNTLSSQNSASEWLNYLIFRTISNIPTDQSHAASHLHHFALSSSLPRFVCVRDNEYFVASPFVLDITVVSYGEAPANIVAGVPTETAVMRPARKDFILGLKGERFRGERSSSEQCIICYETFRVGYSVTRLPCSHVFHGRCIKKWLRRSHLCPLCRFQMPN
ncbi:uncharacterized protein LOC126672974 [Mercurialis annua]|uniref:uncharacterized protein LOC126672974 n=1 Tax=Mercurialis annua TaxID=3986 RepID=UPI00215E4B83|nr:uncharacterized protein LOC126672974 [Mercurialis annua]